jgi:hypothetical protein
MQPAGATMACCVLETGRQVHGRAGHMFDRSWDTVTKGYSGAASWRYDGVLCVGDGETGAREGGTHV